jgi:hypothetical protein
VARVQLTGTPERIAPVAKALFEAGHAVRCAVPGGTPVVEGAETVDGSPQLPGSLVMHLEGVAVVGWLLGDEASSDPELHGEKLETMLHRVVDTGVRGFIYELPGGYADAKDMAHMGAARIAKANDTWKIPVAAVGPQDENLSLAVSAAVDGLLAA